MEAPICEEHGIPKRWRRARRKPKGGYWECPKHRRASKARYRASAKAREAKARYAASAEGRATQARYNQSEKGLERNRECRRRKLGWYDESWTEEDEQNSGRFFA